MLATLQSSCEVFGEIEAKKHVDAARQYHVSLVGFQLPDFCYPAPLRAAAAAVAAAAAAAADAAASVFWLEILWLKRMASLVYSLPVVNFARKVLRVRRTICV
jgi:hypothetical protein